MSGDVDYRLRDDYRLSGATRHFTPAKWADQTAPRIEWLVEGCFMPGAVSLISSDGGLGKSLLMQQLCTAAALGKPWLGFATRRVRTYALFCEDAEDELWRRQERINRHYECRNGDLEDATYKSRPGLYNILCEFDRWDAMPRPTPLFHIMQAEAGKYGAQIIVLDTATDIFGGNEIAKDQVRAFITLLRRWAIMASAAVILTAHVSNEGLATASGLSGSRAWSNSVRSRLWLTDGKKDKAGNLLDPDVRQLRGMKNNYAARGKPVDLKYRNGVFERVEIQVRDWSDTDPF